jgi:hypothetical protein
MGVRLPNKRLQPDQAAFRILQHFVVPKANDPIPFFLNGAGPRRICCIRVLTAINFDYQLEPMARKIGDVMAQRHLPAPSAIRDALAQQTPHVLFRKRCIPPQVAGANRRNGWRELLHKTSL